MGMCESGNNGHPLPGKGFSNLPKPENSFIYSAQSMRENRNEHFAEVLRNTDDHGGFLPQSPGDAKRGISTSVHNNSKIQRYF